MTVLYDASAPGDWGSLQQAPQVPFTTETLNMSDNCKLFLRGWQTGSQNVLLLLHGLGAHSGWFIDMGNELAASGLTVYAVDHRGFGRSEGLPGHIERFTTYIDDLGIVVQELRKRHSQNGQQVRFFLLGHSMGGILATHFAARHADLLHGVLFLNPWVRDSVKIPVRLTLSILGASLVRSRRRWRNPGGTEGMTTNPEAVKMLEADPYWRRDLTGHFFLQISRMRLQMLTLAGKIQLPALVIQVEKDKSVIQEASHQFYAALASADKTWKTYPDYAHDTELEVNRAQLDQDIVKWIQGHTD